MLIQYVISALADPGKAGSATVMEIIDRARAGAVMDRDRAVA